MENNIETTQGTKVSDWGEAYETNNTNAGDDFLEKEMKGGSWQAETARNIPKIFKELESNLPFTVMIVSIIGYILIASFGQMDSINKYFGYLLFLVLMFFGYKILKYNKFSFWKVITSKKVNRFLLILLIVSVIFILIQNFDSILWFCHWIKSFFVRK